MIRAATAADLEFVHRLYNDESVNPFISYDPMPLAEFATEFQHLLTDVEIMIFEENGRPAGGCTVHRGSHRLRHSAHLGGIAVAPELQNQGVGKRMMTALFDQLRSDGIVRVELCVSTDNPRGIAFYEKLGFVREGTLKRFFSRAGLDGYFDEYAMALFLD